MVPTVSVLAAGIKIGGLAWMVTTLALPAGILVPSVQVIPTLFSLWLTSVVEG